MVSAVASPLDKLRAMSNKTKASRSKTPEATIPELNDTIAAWRQAKAQRDSFDSLMQAHEAQIIAAAREARYEACRRDYTVHSSVRINGSVTITQTCRYSKIPDETPAQQQRVAELEAAFGADYPRYFAEQLSVSLTDEATEDQKFLGELIAAVEERFGSEEFSRRFKVARALMPTKAFHEALALRPEVREKAEPFLSDETVKPYKASCRP